MSTVSIYYLALIYWEQRPRCVKEKDLGRIPVRVYKTVCVTPDDTPVRQVNTLCTICFEDFKEDERLRVLRCGHEFHAACVDPWFRRCARVCPLCKRDVVKWERGKVVL